MSTQLPVTNPPLVCWNCHEAHHRHALLSGCGKLLQLPLGSDYFAMFELPRKLWIEMGALEQKFLQLSWKLHPTILSARPSRNAKFHSSAARN